MVLRSLGTPGGGVAADAATGCRTPVTVVSTTMAAEVARALRRLVEMPERKEFTRSSTFELGTE